jgi:hypothetical protein
VVVPDHPEVHVDDLAADDGGAGGPPGRSALQGPGQVVGRAGGQQPENDVGAGQPGYHQADRAVAATEDQQPAPALIASSDDPGQRHRVLDGEGADQRQSELGQLPPGWSKSA